MANNLVVHYPKCPQQDNNVHCGWYVLYNIKKIVAAENPDICLHGTYRNCYVKIEIETFRADIVDEILLLANARLQKNGDH